MSLQRTDFLLNSPVIISGKKVYDFPLQDTVVNGVWLDTPFGSSDFQHVKDGIYYIKGWLKSTPTYGFGINQYLNSEYNQSIYGGLKQELLKDGYITSPGFVKPVLGGGFIVNAIAKYVKRK